MVNEYLLLSNYGMTSVNIQIQSSKLKFEFTGPNQIVNCRGWIYMNELKGNLLYGGGGS
jgi:hypothetical protein